MSEASAKRREIAEWISKGMASAAAGAIDRLIELRIAEHEAAKASAPAASPERDEPEERAEGVPEWFSHIVTWHNTSVSDYQIKAIWQKVAAEITRRVAEDRRDALCHCQKKLKEARAERDAARAEVDMLKVRCDLAEHSREKFRARIAELEARVAEQAKEIERLSRPVEDKPTLDGEHIFHGGTHWINHDSAVRLVQRERNSREAAEAALAELREFCRHQAVSLVSVKGIRYVEPMPRSHPLTDAELDAVLAEFRKIKEPTK